MEQKWVVSKIRSHPLAWIEVSNPKKPILLFLHGYPDTAESWEYQIDFFKKDYEILCPFQQGIFPSNKKPNRSCFETSSVILDLLTLLKNKDPNSTRKVILVGHDLGAVYAWELAPLIKKQLKALVILNGFSLPQMKKHLKKWPQQKLKSWYIALMQIPWLPEIVLKSSPKTFLNLAYRLGGLSAKKRGAYDKNAVIFPIEQYRALWKEAFNKKRKLSSQKIDTPTLVLFGALDTFLVPPEEEELSPWGSNITIRIVEGNHWVHREVPDKINLLIEKFIGKKK